MRGAPFVALLGFALPAALGAQTRITANTAVLFEDYQFGDGLSFNRVSEMTVPLGVRLQLGSRGDLTLSTGFARVDLQSDDSTLGNRQVSGAIDTEIRLGFNVIPGKVVALVIGALPTGIKTVEFNDLAILGAIASDVIGFSASNLGTGGNVGGGFAGAVPLGQFAVGFGATFKQPLGYTPILRRPSELRPGNELRLRAGFEGPLLRRTYLRAAAILARTSKDRIAVTDTASKAVADSTRHGVGNRLIGYLSVNHAIGPASVTLYGFDVFRGNPQVEPTAIGAARLPRGNLIALGGRVDLRLGSAMFVSPRAEYRMSAQAPDDTTNTLRRLGDSMRFGVDVRRQVTPLVAAVLQGDGILGHVIQDKAIKINGFRMALHLEFTP